VLQEHMEGVWCLKFDGEKLISGGGDRSVKVWDLKDMWCVNTLQGHTGPVTCLDFSNHKLVTGSVDQTIRIWDFSDASALSDTKVPQDAGVQPRPQSETCLLQ